MRQITGILSFEPRHPGLHLITPRITEWVAAQDAETGLLTLLCQHTSASILIQENADPDVMRDLQDAFEGLAPQGGAELYRHTQEGPDDMSAHIRATLTGVNLAIPVMEGRLVLGTWQGIFLWEHRNRPRVRKVAAHLLAD